MGVEHKQKSVFVAPQFSVSHAITSSGVAPHAHFEHVIGYYFSGHSRCLIGDQVVEYNAGDVSLLNPGEAHEDLPLAEERDYISIALKEELLKNILSDIGSSREDLPYFPAFRMENDVHLRRICEELRSESQGYEFGRELLLKSLVTELAVYILRRFLPSHRADQIITSDPSELHLRVRKAIEYLHDTYTQDFQLERVSAAANLSKFHLDRVFKRATGLRPHTYMTLLRVERAKEILAESSKPIAEIALDLGFADQSHFSNVFRRFSGLSPHAYRIAAGNSKQP